MRIIKPSKLEEYSAAHRDAAGWLNAWLDIAQIADWQSIRDVRRTFPHADAVTLVSGNVVTIFNVNANRYRQVVAIHCNGGRIHVRDFMTHAGYNNERWKRR